MVPLLTLFETADGIRLGRAVLVHGF